MKTSTANFLPGLSVVEHLSSRRLEAPRLAGSSPAPPGVSPANAGAVRREAPERRGLAGDRLDELSDCHPRREGVRVDYHVWHDAVLGVRHVLLGDDEPDDSLLTVARGELVADLRCPHVPDPDLEHPPALDVLGHEDRSPRRRSRSA